MILICCSSRIPLSVCRFRHLKIYFLRHYRHGRKDFEFPKADCVTNVIVKCPDKSMKELLTSLTWKVPRFYKVGSHFMNQILSHEDFPSKVSHEERILILTAVQLVMDRLPVVRAEFAWRIWNAITANFAVGHEEYHLLLRVLLSTEQEINVDKVLDEMRTNQVKPNATTYSLLARCVCETSSVSQIPKVMELAKENQFSVDKSAYNSMIYAFARTGDLETATNVMHSLSNQVEPSSVASLLRGIGELSKADVFHEVMTQIADNNINFNQTDKLQIVRGLSEGNLCLCIPKILGSVEDWEFSLFHLCNECIRCMYRNKHDAVTTFLLYLDTYMVEPFTNEDLSRTVLIGTYLVEEMVKSKMPANTIAEFCRKYKSYPIILSQATYLSLRLQDYQYFWLLVEMMEENGFPIKPHYFWSLFVSLKKKKATYIEYANVLKRMIQLKVTPDFETLFQFVYLNLGSRNPYSLMKKLHETGISKEILVAPMICMLIRFRPTLDSAIKMCEEFGIRVDFSHMLRNLIEILIKTEDVDAVLMLLSHGDRKALSALLHLLFHDRRVQPELLEKVLNRIDLSKLHPTTLHELRLNVKHKGLSGDWLDKFLLKDTYDMSDLPHQRDMNVVQLENHLVELKKRNFPTRQALRRLLLMYSDLGNMDRVQEVVKELSEQNYKLSPGMKATIMSAYCHQADVENAYKIYKEICDKTAGIQIVTSRIIQLATLLAKKKDLESVVNLLKECKLNLEIDNHAAHKASYLVRAITNKYGLEAGQLVLKLLTEKRYCHVAAPLLYPIITWYLLRNNVEQAVNECLMYGNKYRILPKRGTLMSELTVLVETIEDKTLRKTYRDLLKTLLQTSYYLYGQSSTNMVYVSALADRNLVTALKRFLMDSFTGIEEKVMWNECNKLGDLGKLQLLCTMEDAFKNVQSYNIDPIYLNMLKIHSRNGDYNAAKELLNSICESNRMPSAGFLNMFTEMQEKYES